MFAVAEEQLVFDLVCWSRQTESERENMFTVNEKEQYDLLIRKDREIQIDASLRLGLLKVGKLQCSAEINVDIGPLVTNYPLEDH